MKRVLHPILRFAAGPAGLPVFLLGLCLLAYGALIPKLGFYWDDFPINWIASTMGSEGLTRYFSTNRPVWGLIYKITTPLLGSAPLPWQVFGLLMRWVTGLALWYLLRLVWRGRESFAAWAAMLFVLYPGFSQQSTAFMYSHFYIVLTSYLLSLILMVKALRAQKQRRFWLLSAAAGLFSLLNMLAMEYFFLLDLLRPALMWIVLRQQAPSEPPLRRARRVALLWLPFLALFGGAIFWRSVLLGFQTYQPTLMSRLRAEPLAALAGLALVVFQDLWRTTVGAWALPFQLPDAAGLGTLYTRLHWLLSAVGAAAISVFLTLLPWDQSAGRRSGRWNTWALEPVALGLLALLLAGGPFWLTDLPVTLIFPNDRFTLSFMLGASLLLAGLLALLPLPRWPVAAALGMVLGLAIGLQFQNGVEYNRDWSMQRAMFWQLVWRAPDLQPGTVLLINELPMRHYSDNSLSAPLNWIYDTQQDPAVMKYILFFPTLRQQSALRYFEPGQPIAHNYLATTFYGSTDQIVSLYYQPPGCLRVLDPEIEIANWMVTNYLRETLWLASQQPILPAAAPGKPQPQLPPQIFGSEIARGWCYYYQKADLARQMGAWEEVARLGDEAFALGDYPNDPAERLPFIEGYAHTGRWEQAAALTRETRAVTDVMQPVLCRLWERIERDTTAQAERDQTIQTIRAELGCEGP